MKLKEKIDEQKNLVFWQDQQSDKCLGRLTERRRKAQMTNIRNETMNIIRNPAGIKAIVMDYYKQLYTQIQQLK